MGSCLRSSGLAEDRTVNRFGDLDCGFVSF
jgi:hypothetical protein